MSDVVWEKPKSFSFFVSFFDSAQAMDADEVGRWYSGIINYAFTGVEPDFSNNRVLLIAWKNVQPNILASVQKSLDGSKGGRGNKKASAKESPNSSAKGASKSRKKTASRSTKAGFSGPSESDTPSPTPIPYSYPPSAPMEELTPTEVEERVLQKAVNDLAPYGYVPSEVEGTLRDHYYAGGPAQLRQVMGDLISKANSKNQVAAYSHASPDDVYDDIPF